MAYDSETAVCNLALGWVGANKISSFADESAEAQLCKDNFDIARDTTLEARNWTFATKRAQLNLSAETPPFEYKYKFVLPSDCLRVIQASDDIAFTHFDFEWVREENYLFSNSPKMYIRYIARIKDLVRFSSSFTMALVAQLAAILAIPITSKVALMDANLQKYDYFIEVAGGNDGVQGKNEVFQNDSLLRVR